MKKLLCLLATLLLVGAGTAQAQRAYEQGELDALLAPVALQPDPVLSQLLMAATYPEQVAEAARWTRANPHLKGEDAVRAVAGEPWDPSVKSLVAFPELLARMDESPQWLRDLGEAFLAQEAQVMNTVQDLRRRAQANGQLATTEQTAVYSQGEAIVIQPRAQVVYVSYYDPYIVYGPWWWPHYRPVYWRPWAPRAAFFTYGVFYSSPDWHHRHVRVVHRPVYVHHHHAPIHTGRWQHPRHHHQHGHQHYVKTPESQRQPIVRHPPSPLSSPVKERPQPRPPQAREPMRQPMPAASGFSPRTEHRAEPRREQRAEPRREQRTEPRREQHRFESHHNQRGRESRGGGREHRGNGRG